MGMMDVGLVYICMDGLLSVDCNMMVIDDSCKWYSLEMSWWWLQIYIGIQWKMPYTQAAKKISNDVKGSQKSANNKVTLN